MRATIQHREPRAVLEHDHDGTYITDTVAIAIQLTVVRRRRAVVTGLRADERDTQECIRMDAPGEASDCYDVGAASTRRTMTDSDSNTSAPTLPKRSPSEFF
jgi:hypothetical protein